jgi:pimeloyl-ACP methyl ester carboxylesterase
MWISQYGPLMFKGLIRHAVAAMVSGVCLGAISARADAPAAANYTVEKGDIQGAAFAIALPPGQWNRKILLLAHGYRPVTAPLLADLHPERASLKAALDDGWIVATTSFRRNGMVVGDSIADMDALRAYIVNEFGAPERVILEGESMGGLIVTIMAERDKALYDGAIVFDSTFYVKEPNGQIGISLLPRIPLLLVATQKEYLQSMRYVTSLVSRPSPTVQPVLFVIQREGHTNINQAEHLEAFQAMNDWIERGSDALPQPKNQAQYFDATIPADPGPSTAEVDSEAHSIGSRVAEVDAVYGNVLLEAEAQDFQAAGIPLMTYFTLEVNGKSYRTLYARTYADVKEGEWVAFADADGRTVAARFMADAAKTAGLSVGTPVKMTAAAGATPSR